MSLKGLPGTRWFEPADAVKALIEGWDSIQEVMNKLVTDEEQKLDARNQADGFLRKMDEFETAKMTFVWNEILGRFNGTSMSLQDPTVSLKTATGLMKSLVNIVQFAQVRFDVYELMTIEKVKHDEYVAEKRRDRRQKQMPHERAKNEEDLSPREKFETQIYLVIMDRLIADLQKRVKAYDEISEIFGFLSELTSLSTEQITNKAQNLISSYLDDLENTLVAELIQFAAFTRTQKPENVNESRELIMYKLLSTLYLSQF